jgi:hypothetical protein
MKNINMNRVVKYVQESFLSLHLQALHLVQAVTLDGREKNMLDY